MAGNVYTPLYVVKYTSLFALLILFININWQKTQFIHIWSTLSDDVTQLFPDYENPVTRTYHTVCVTYKKTSKSFISPKTGAFWYTGVNGTYYYLPGRACLHERKLITIYDDSYSLLRDSMPPSLKVFGLKFRPASERPLSYNIISNQTAYFLGEERTFEPNNFFHFTRQVYFPLYWLIKATKQLHKNANNLVFYPKPYAFCVENRYYPLDSKRYQQFRDILYVKNKGELGAHVDTPLPDKVCYKNAVFSCGLFIDKALMAIDYFKNQIGVRNSLCTSKLEILTIINRSSYRRILNVGQLRRIGAALGYDTRVVSLETMTLREQAQLIHCTRVLVGVVGAGLQWAFFMKNHSGVVEIGWPQKKWRFFFTGTDSYQSMERDVIRPLNFVQLSNVTCHLNPFSLSILFRDLYPLNRTVSPEEAMAILHDERNFDYILKPAINIGKLCDVIVDTEAFKQAVVSAAKTK